MFGEITFRPLNRSDFPLLQWWLAESHVDAWWHQPLDLAGLEDKYGPRVYGVEPAYVFVIEYGKRSIGFIQWYRWSEYTEHAAQLGAEPEAAGIDLAIGEPEMIGLELGPLAIREFVKQVVFADQGIRAVITDVAVSNLRSLRAFEKAGFCQTGIVQLRGEDFQRRVMHLRKISKCVTT
jgi:aminoglycoside 6'-N-acetyltransferase